MTVFETFEEFMHKSVLPLRRVNREWIRLDGETTGGTRKAFGYFRHAGQIWKVDADTRFEPLELALEAFAAGKEPFIEHATARSAKRKCLMLAPEINQHRKSGPKYLYIYLRR